MAFQMWIHQERDAPEPWAVHVWVFDNGLLDMAIYAEWLPHGAKRHVDIPATFEGFLDALSSTCLQWGHPVGTADIEQLGKAWANMAIKVGK